MTVHFQPAPIPKGFKAFDPSNVVHYANLNIPGIYIYGLRLDIEKVKKFVPQYVGISEDLGKRLLEHYNQESNSTNGNSKKEIFDFSKTNHSVQDIIERYSDMLIYDLVTNSNLKTKQRPIISYLQNLIWFQDLTFYNAKLGICNCPCNIYKNDSNHADSIKQNGFLDQLHSINPFLGANNIKQKCFDTKTKFDNDFYFVYARLDDLSHISMDNECELQIKYPDFRNPNKYKKSIGEKFAERVELATKKALNHIGIHTTAKAKGEFFSMDVDLTQISSELINIGNHPFNYSNLIIKMKK